MPELVLGRGPAVEKLCSKVIPALNVSQLNLFMHFPSLSCILQFPSIKLYRYFKIPWHIKSRIIVKWCEYMNKDNLNDEVKEDEMDRASSTHGVSGMHIGC
jgi:hypothetical protein